MKNRKRYPTTLPPRRSDGLAVRQAPVPALRYLEHQQPPVVFISEEQYAAQLRRDEILVARWKQRQAAIKARDAKVRRFWLGFGAVFALPFVAALIWAGWLLWTAVGLGVLAVPVMVALATAAAVGGHRCITVVQHWH